MSIETFRDLFEECLSKELNEEAEKEPAPKKRTFILAGISLERMTPDKNQLVSGNSSKAGLPSSLEEINSRISEASKDSRFTAAQERKNAELEAKLQIQKDQLKKSMEQASLVIKAKKMVDGLMRKYEMEQSEQFLKYKEFCWVCVDMDAFFASVECLDDPSLRDIPMAVGSSAMLSTSNYAARKFGVSAAMPGYIAQKLCPQLKIVPANFDRYREMSGKVAEILCKYDPNLSMWSLDEAFLKLKSENGDDFAAIVQRMREEVKLVTGLTCSAGIACNPLLAKLASNFRKPDGQFEINRSDPHAMRKFLFDQPVRKICGLGRVMSLTLEKVFEVRKIGELYEKRHLLPLIFKDKTVKSLVSKSIGHSLSDETEMGDSSEFSGQKSLSCERTFQASTVDLIEVLREIAENLENDLVEMNGLVEVCRVGIKVKSADFRVFTREKRSNLKVPISKEIIFKAAEGILTEFLGSEEDMQIRLLGVRLSNLQYADESKKRPVSSVLEKWLDDSKAKCPICLKAFKDENDLSAVNGHIDDCLTKSTLKEILSEEKNK